MLHAEVDKNLWSEHSVEASLFPLSSCNQAWLRNSCATHGSCNRRSLAANRGEWGSYVTVCWDHPLRIVEKKPCQREDHLLLPTGVFFLWNTNSNLGRFKEPGLQETSSRCTAHRDSGEIVSFGPGGGSCAAQSNPTIVQWHVATEVWKLLAAITFFLCLRGGGSSFSKLIRLPKGSFVCQKKNNYNWWKTFLLIVLCSHVLHPLVGYGSKSPWIMRSYPRNIWVMVSNSY